MTLYICISKNVIDEETFRIISKLKIYGEIIIGLLTNDILEANGYKNLLSFEERKVLFKNINGVKMVVPQYTLDPSENIIGLKPNYVYCSEKINTDINSYGVIKKIIEEWNGTIISDINLNDDINLEIKGSENSIKTKRTSLKNLLKDKEVVRILEAHDGITGLIVEKTKVQDNEGRIKEYDGMWISSLCDSISKGKPDMEIVDMSSRINNINDILEVTEKPIIVDADTGGKIEQFKFNVKTLSRLGTSAVIIEDKIGTKRNSLFGDKAYQEQDSIENFSKKIEAGIKSRVKEDFMIIARIESLILNVGIDDAIERAESYIKAGADGILIHSNKKDGIEILEFCKRYNKLKNRVPLAVIPTTYSYIYEDQLIDAGCNIIIYANYLTRSALPIMMKTAKSILKNKRALEVSEYCMSVKDIITLIPEEV